MHDQIEQLKALGEANRFRIMMMLRARPLCVCELLDVLDVSGATLSNHLKTLKYAGLVSSRRDGKWMEYSMVDSQSGFISGLYERCADTSQLDADTRRLSNIDRNVCSVSYAPLVDASSES